MYCNRVVQKKYFFVMPQCYTQRNIMLGYVHSPSVEAFTLLKLVLILFSNFVKSCGIFLLEIGFLKALYMGLSQMIKYLHHTLFAR